MESKTGSLYFRQNLTPDSVNDMKLFRKQIIGLSSLLDQYGSSRELSLAFTALEQAQMYFNKHICLTDSQATKESLETDL